MSQIAQGFACPSAVLARANAHCRSGKRTGMAAVLSPHELAAFGHSGYVIVVLVEWLKSRGVSLHRTVTAETADLVRVEDPLLCMPQREAIAVLTAVRLLSPSSEELSAFWREWTGEDTAEAHEFMPAGLSWLTAVAEAGTHSDWCLVLEG